MSQLRNSTLLYRPSLSVWTARKKDKAESLKVNKDAGAVDGAANVNKQLLPDSAELLAVQKGATAFRTWVYDVTLPWDDTGMRIGRVDRHMDFMAEAGDRMRALDDLVDKFLSTYEAEVAQAQFKLNNMFNASDYPSTDVVRSKFRFSIETHVMPAGDDFRDVEGIAPVEVERLISDATAAADIRVSAAMEEANARLYEVISKMASTLTDFSNKRIKKFNNSLVENITALVDLMPALNLTGDPKLAALAKKAKALTLYDPDDLRKDEGARNTAIEEALALAKMFGADEPEVAAGNVTVVIDAQTSVEPDVASLLTSDWD